jgi:dienelactone hydrolase
VNEAGGADASTAAVTEPLPRFTDTEVGMYATTIPPRGDPADVYHPKPTDLDAGTQAFPIAVMLQGANVDKQHYAALSRAIAGHGFIVVVGNHAGLFGLYAEQQQVVDALAFMRAEHARAESPVYGAVDVDTLVVLGHSFGGVAGLGAVQGTCGAPFCTGTFVRPPELKAAALFGTNNGAMSMPIMTASIGVALVQGDKDGKALPADAKTTYDALAAPRALFTIAGANHYGVCDGDNPSGAAAEATAPTLAQADAIRANASAAAWFLRAVALDDAASMAWLRATTMHGAIALAADL